MVWEEGKAFKRYLACEPGALGVGDGRKEVIIRDIFLLIFSK